jgi:hypothetical protein
MTCEYAQLPKWSNRFFTEAVREKLQDHRRREENEYLGTSRKLLASGECKSDAAEVTRGSPGRVQKTAINESK